MSQESKLTIFKDRANCLKKVRSFFDNKNVLEVDVPVLCRCPTIDNHIKSIKAYPIDEKAFYLHTSPEYFMKRLLSLGLKDIYFLSHVFRKEEVGKKHNFEFSMIEWYRSNISFDNFLNEVIELIKIFINFEKVEKITYRDLFSQFLKLDIYKCEKIDLLKKCKNLEIDLFNPKDFKKDDFLNLLFDFIIEKKATRDILYIVHDFPITQASLAKTYIVDNIEVAKRFEFFLNGFELGNGFHELDDEKEQRKRFEKVIENKKELFLDENFLKSINQIGDCYGIALGFDRLLMLKHKKEDIVDVLYFSLDSL